MNASFGKRIRQVRESRGLKAFQVASAIGRPPSYVSDLELDKRTECPPPDVISGLSRVLDVPVADLLRWWGYNIPDGPSPAYGDFRLREIVENWPRFRTPVQLTIHKIVRDMLDNPIMRVEDSEEPVVAVAR